MASETLVQRESILADVPRTAEETIRKGASNILTGKGGVYIHPGRLEELLKQQETDKSSESYQRFAWEALKKSINGLVNKVNIANIQHVVQELFRENLIRGRYFCILIKSGILTQYIIRAQNNSPIFTHVYAALVSVINTKLPRIGELILRRLIINFRRAYERNDKSTCVNTAKFLAHLANQNVCHELLVLEILTLLLSKPTNDSVEVAISFLKEVGAKLFDVSPKGSLAIFERLRNILHDSLVDMRVQYMIEVMFAVRKDKYKDYEIIAKELDLVEEEDQITHLLRLNDQGSTEDELSMNFILLYLIDVFIYDPLYEDTENKYHEIKTDILGSSSDEELNEEEENEIEHDIQEEISDSQPIIDQTFTNTINLRRTIYLLVQSSLDFEECAHKLLKMKLMPAQEHEFCSMLMDCCIQQRTYEKFYGLLCERLCLLKKEFMECFMSLYKEHYETCHRLDSVKLRNASLLFAHLLYSDAIPWTVLEVVHLNEEETTSSSRIFLKHVFQSLSQEMSIPTLKERFNDETLKSYFDGIFPRDNPRSTRFSINFFTSIGLGKLTDDLREFLNTSSSTALHASLSTAAPLHPLLAEAAKVVQITKQTIQSTNSSCDELSKSSSSASRSPTPKRKSRKSPPPPRSKFSSRSGSIRRSRKRSSHSRTPPRSKQNRR
ncbi:hypothetical protein HZS_6236 [Henneguya salminicola]|nr:hypothetical protein HZS_6236 [Henneguya salminicola]